ncbi:interferon alpha/beta receptor 2 [Pipistrellus kuhlii]|uniref:interferon alpha/beta receptor 2 n=1 Tax=Pipistrellus kuhlii TaxID=59472 RepID=UPI001E272FDF|nr:interferon alpha/beta receptor 2 [Pipistrellus kuhlii]
MPWTRRAVAMRLASLCLMVQAGPALGAPHRWPESSDESCIFSLTLRDFRPILSWELKNRSIMPTHYTLWHTDMSGSDVPLELVPECANTTRASCDLTQHWRSLTEMYLPRLVGSRGGATLVDCGGSIFPDTDMILEPPEFEVTGFEDHINVTLKFPPALPKLRPGEGLWLHLSLSIEEESEGVVKQHLLQIGEHTTGNFTYVIDKLAPNTNYCVSVCLKGNFLSKSQRSPWKCTRLPPRLDSEASAPAAVGGLVALLLAAVLGSALAILRQVGCICLRSKVPKALNLYGVPIWAFPERPALEAVAVAEVIPVHRKRRVWDYSYGDESDGEEAEPRASAGAYTTHGLAARPLCPGPPSSATPGAGEEAEALMASEGPGSWGAERTGGAYEGPGPWPAERTGRASEGPGRSWGAGRAYEGPGPWPAERTGRASEGEAGAWPADPFPQEDSSPTESPGDRIFFNVDLSSVLVRVPDGEDSGAPAVFGPPEETGGLEDSEDSTPGPEEAPCGECDTSTSNAGLGGGYMMR